jgi:hypothetical protein
LATWDFKAIATSSGTLREQKKVEEASNTVMPMASNVRMTIVKNAKANQTTKLLKPHQHEQKQKEHGS